MGESAAKLDESLYDLQGQELEFFRRQTGIDDSEDLKRHILDVQKKAYAIHGYPCIRGFGFLRLKISKLPAYRKALDLRFRPNALFLDIGCCFGNDVRKIVEDGWPADRAVASDLYSDFWDCGHELFKSTAETFPVTFVPGDAFDPAMIEPRAPFYSGDPESPPPLPSNLSGLKSLTPLQGHFTAIHASSFFHLFSEERQVVLARQLASLLSPEPGSMIFGMHVALPTKGVRWEHEANGLEGRNMFCHSPETWKEVWLGGPDGQSGVFKPGTVDVIAGLAKVERKSVASLDPKAEFWVMWWSVKRL